MELTFEKVGNQYVAEFQAPSDFNLHIEREEIGVLEVHQRGSEEGKYDFAWSTGVNGRKVVDYDFGALVYPKYIKVVSGSEVVSASVNFNEGGGSGSGSGNESKWEYYRIDWSDENLINIVENELGESLFREIIIGASQFVNYTGEFDINYIVSSTNYVLDGYVQENNIRANKIAAYPFAIYNNDTMIDKDSWIEILKATNNWMYQEPTWLKPITKEEFYSFDNNNVPVS